MPLELIGNELTSDGKYRTFRIKDENFLSLVVVIDARDQVNVDYLNGDTKQVVLRITKPENAG